MDSWIIGKDDPSDVAAYVAELKNRSRSDIIVCFDYFDTVITRVVEPEHTKVLACTLLGKAVRSKFSGSELYAYRRDLELEMTNLNGENSGELDFRLDLFAAHFWDLLQKKDESIRCLNKSSFISLIVDIEVAVERAVQRVCPHVESLIRVLSKQGIKLLLVSDFYLPEDAFDLMLQHFRLGSYFSKVYISSAYQKSKGSGSMYTEICKQHKCSPENMLMIGDNLHADVHMANEAGLKALHVRRPEQEKLYKAFREEKKMNSKIEPGQLFNSITLPQTDFSEMGISLWLFIHRLYDELQTNKVKDIFFLSKEGEFLKKLFDQYQSLLFGQHLIKSHYLIASRKATFIGSLRPLKDEDFRRLLDHYRDLSLREFLLSLNFEEETVDGLAKKIPLDFENRLTDLKHRPELKQLLANDSFKVEYEFLRSSQAANFRKYLESFGCDFSQTGLHIVDVGWKGSIQDNIFYILGGSVTVQGYFVGSYNGTERSKTNIKKGILFDNFPRETPFFRVYNNNRSLFEMMLGASHGSAACYLSSDQFEKLPDDSSVQEYEVCGEAEEVIHVMVLDLPEERKLYESVIKNLQDSMNNLFREMTTTYLKSECRIPADDWFARHHARMVFRPKQAEIASFEDLYHLENFGIFEYTNFRSVNDFSFIDRLRNLRAILNDPIILESGIWPPIILRRLGVGEYQRVDGLKRYFKEFGFVFSRNIPKSSNIEN